LSAGPRGGCLWGGPQTLGSRNNLAGAYELAGDLGRAIPLYEQILTDSMRVLGQDHPDTLASRNNLAYLAITSGGNRKPAKTEVVAARSRWSLPLEELHTGRCRSRSTGHASGFRFTVAGWPWCSPLPAAD